MERFRPTLRASYAGLFTQAIVNNLAPLLFIIFHTRLDIPVAQLGGLAALNFVVQLVTDIAAVNLVDRMGYRKPLVAGHGLVAAGLLLLSVLPLTMASPLAGLAIAITVYAIGGGLLEVVVSPVVDALPTPSDAKAARMALLHSFYCWGQLAVVVGSTVLLGAFGQRHWPLLPLLWAVIPAANMVAFLKVPLPGTVAEEDRTPIRKLFGTPLFLAALVLMLTGGAAELTMAQWSSFFAQQATRVSKEVGDLMGPGLFALLMGAGRFSYGMWGSKLAIEKLLVGSSLLASISYVVAATSPVPVVSLLSTAVCGLAVSLLWPGTISLTSARFPAGGAAMFAILAVAGDAGGVIGPFLAGLVADIGADGVLAPLALWLPSDGGTGIRTGILVCTFLPILYAITATTFLRQRAARQDDGPASIGILDHSNR